MSNPNIIKPSAHKTSFFSDSPANNTGRESLLESERGSCAAVGLGGFLVVFALIGTPYAFIKYKTDIPEDIAVTAEGTHTTITDVLPIQQINLQKVVAKSSGTQSAYQAFGDGLIGSITRVRQEVTIKSAELTADIGLVDTVAKLIDIDEENRILTYELPPDSVQSSVNSESYVDYEESPSNNFLVWEIAAQVTDQLVPAQYDNSSPVHRWLKRKSDENDSITEVLRALSLEVAQTKALPKCVNEVWDSGSKELFVDSLENLIRQQLLPEYQDYKIVITGLPTSVGFDELNQMPEEIDLAADDATITIKEGNPDQITCDTTAITPGSGKDNKED